jgi:predicted peroxiredoxin
MIKRMNANSTYGVVEMPLVVSHYAHGMGDTYSVYFTLEGMPHAMRAHYTATRSLNATYLHVRRQDGASLTMMEEAWVRQAVAAYDAKEKEAA